VGWRRFGNGYTGDAFGCLGCVLDNACEHDTVAQDRQRLFTFSEIRRDTSAVNARRYSTKYILMRVIARVMHCWNRGSNERFAWVIEHTHDVSSS